MTPSTPVPPARPSSPGASPKPPSRGDAVGLYVFMALVVLGVVAVAYAFMRL